MGSALHVLGIPCGEAEGTEENSEGKTGQLV